MALLKLDMITVWDLTISFNPRVSSLFPKLEVMDGEMKKGQYSLRITYHLLTMCVADDNTVCTLILK